MSEHRILERVRRGVRSIAAPRRTWRSMGSAARYIAYTRISLQLMGVGMLFVMFVSVLGAAAERGLEPGWVALPGAAVLVSVGLTLCIFELHPDLNSRERRSHLPFFRSGLIYNLLVWALCLGIVVLPVQGQLRALAGFAAVNIVFNLALAYLPWLRYRWWVCLVLALVTSAVIQVISGIGWAGYLWGVGAMFLLGTVVLTVWTINLFREVEAARHTEAALQVTEERLRFAQELHDTLGQHLAVMSLKAELSLALARRGDGRLEGELQELQRLAKTSMSEMREVVAGYREVNLATEVAGAHSLLRDSGVGLDVVGDPLDVDKRDRELAAWFVREAVTNVLKHSDARRVRLAMAPGRVSMENDGARGEIGPLSGLSALRSRAENAGAHLLVERDGERFTATLNLEGRP